ncbi:hypothetical protein R5R35_011514 [Gryllus longicercus]|uniref:Alpha-mannosidase n=1 Tax=Gryllus longicercus TaxID=2509291 RepID=A0AAN9V4Y0_9ORTH
MTAAPAWTLLVVCAAVTASVPVQRNDPETQEHCGYESCPPIKDGMINVHLVPHTHDDVGWLKTVDQYFFGSQNNIQKAGVQYILDTVVEELQHDPKKRFIYVETAFFWKWWNRQDDSHRHQVRKLVQQGRLEFIGGGWSMNDEAVTHYQSTIDQMTWGLRRLNDTFGKCGRPRVGWQIDPFGHSREMASIFAQMGYDGLFFGRLDYQDKMNRLSSKTAEMVWQASDNLGKDAELFTHALYNHYSPPPGFCFDVLCDDEPIIDDKHSPDYNVDNRVERFLAFVQNQTKRYVTKNIILTMGGDFTYQDAKMWYSNLDKMIRYVNLRQANGSNINLLYSTPSCYLKAVNDAKLSWTTKQDDFFPYASDSHAYWTGYYTSRPTIKYFERLGNNYLQVCKQLYALTDLGPEDQVDLNALREAMGVMQHHDAITGTEKQKVAFDYARILSRGIAECNIITNTAVNKLVPLRKEYPTPVWENCLKLNVSQCAPSEESKNFVVTVYNPLAQVISPYIRFPVTGSSYKVQDAKGNSLPTQLVPIPEPVQNIPGRMSQATQELVFRAVNLKPLGFQSYFVSQVKSEESNTYISDESNASGNFGHKTYYYTTNRRGVLKTLTTHGVKFQVAQAYGYYEGAVGDNEEAINRSSGAYIFRPKSSTPKIMPNRSQFKTFKGPLVSERHEVINDWLSQVVRIYTDEQHTEVEWLVGPLPIKDGVGKEVIVKYMSELSSKGKFYTDSNGRELLERTRNARPTWHLKLEEPVAGNYYPITSRILLRDTDKKLELAVLTDRAQGGSSLKDGELELMLHRRLLHDDAFGVGEALNETAFGKGLVARGKHYLVGGPSGNVLTVYERQLAQEKLLTPWLLFSRADKYSFESWSKTYRMEFDGVKMPLPANVHLLTLEPWKGRSLLVRLEHILEKGEDPKLSKSVTVSLKNLFAPFEIVSARETMLGANEWKKDSSRLQWKTESNSIDRHEDTHQGSLNHAEDILSVTLEPMQIRTFVVEVKYAGK